MTSKQRAELRAKANSLEALFQIGKGGISDALIAQTDDALRVHELIKLRVHLETSPITPRDAANELSEKTSSDVVQVIGGVIVLYRYNPELYEKKPVIKNSTFKNTSKKKTSRTYVKKKENDKGEKCTLLYSKEDPKKPKKSKRKSQKNTTDQKQRFK